MDKRHKCRASLCAGLRRVCTKAFLCQVKDYSDGNVIDPDYGLPHVELAMARTCAPEEVVQDSIKGHQEHLEEVRGGNYVICFLNHASDLEG